MKILHLTLKKKWFDLIKSGEKKVEYRECKDYWTKRLVDETGSPIKYDRVKFVNGYGRDCPYMFVSWQGLAIAQLFPPQNGEIVNNNDFAIILGEVFKPEKISVEFKFDWAKNESN